MAVQARRRNREMLQAVRLLECELRKEETEYAESLKAANAEVMALKEELQKLRVKAAVKLGFTEAALAAKTEGQEWQQRHEERNQENAIRVLEKETELDSFVVNADAEFINNLIKQAKSKP